MHGGRREADAELIGRIAALLSDEGVALPLIADLGRDTHVDLLAGQLLHRFRERDDSEAFTLLVELAQPSMSRIARLITRQVGLAVDPDDLVAGFLAKLFVDLRRDQPIVVRFLGLARTAMHNEALNQLRLLRRAAARNEAWGRERLAERVADPASRADYAERTARLPRLGTLFLAVVAQCFHALSERERRVLIAREVDKLSYDEIALHLGLRRGQVGMVLKRARESLRRRIDRAFSRLGVPRPEPAEGPSLRARRLARAAAQAAAEAAAGGASRAAAVGEGEPPSRAASA